MKIDVRIDADGFPVLFLTDTPWDAREKLLTCFSQHEGHGGAARGYMRQCKAPDTEAEFIAASKLLMLWASI